MNNEISSQIHTSEVTHPGTGDNNKVRTGEPASAGASERGSIQ